MFVKQPLATLLNIIDVTGILCRTSLKGEKINIGVILVVYTVVLLVKIYAFVVLKLRRTNNKKSTFVVPVAVPL